MTPPSCSDWRVFILHNDCRRVVFSDLVIDGNRLGLTSPDEQSHGIEVEGGTEDLLIDRCILRDCFGDGVRLLGTAAAGKNVRRVRITNCLFQANKRSGLGIQRALEQIVVSHCMFDATVSDQDIDFEPTGADAPTDLLIQGCIINHTNASVAVSLSGIGGASPLLRCKFTDNIVLGGPVFCTDVDQLTVQNNVVVVPDVGSKNRVPLQVQRGGESLLISGNVLVNECAATEAVISLSEVNQRQASRALVSNNLCITRAGRGIQCLSGDDVAIQGNMVVATGSCAAGVFVRSESSGVDGVSVRDNDVTARGGRAWETGIRFAASPTNAIGDLSARDCWPLVQIAEPSLVAARFEASTKRPAQCPTAWPRSASRLPRPEILRRRLRDWHENFLDGCRLRVATKTVNIQIALVDHTCVYPQTSLNMATSVEQEARNFNLYMIRFASDKSPATVDQTRAAVKN